MPAGMRADRVWVSFEKADGPSIRMRIGDNGQGFDVLPVNPDGTPQAPSGHFGLRFMRERVEQFGGALRIESAAGRGTCVEVEVPV